MIDHQRLRRLDLNLLHSLDSLLREQNVSRAATAVGVTQPVMSAALARLRRHFGDELLVRRTNRYELTPLGRQLRPAVTEALRAVDRVVGGRTRFTADLDVEFVVVCGEVVGAMLLPDLRRRMVADAPRTTLRVLDPRDMAMASVGDRLVENVDGAIFPHGWMSELESIDVLEDQWVFVVAADDPVERLTFTDLNTRPWLVAQIGSDRGGIVRGMQQVLAAGVRAHVDVTVSASMAVPFYLRGTDRIAVMGRESVLAMGELMGVREVPGPFELETLKTAFWWHPSRRGDPVHRWFRSIIADLGSARIRRSQL
jgi:DNA-binding transcriptional LysR family regulator